MKYNSIEILPPYREHLSFPGFTDLNTLKLYQLTIKEKLKNILATINCNSRYDRVAGRVQCPAAQRHPADTAWF